jgi:hypothetical protein
MGGYHYCNCGALQASYTATVQKGAWAKVHHSSVLVALILIKNTFPYKSNQKTQVNLHQ